MPIIAVLVAFCLEDLALKSKFQKMFSIVNMKTNSENTQLLCRQLRIWLNDSIFLNFGYELSFKYTYKCM